MENFPNTPLELANCFGTEESCREYLYKIRWRNGFICPHCGHKRYWIRENGQYQCKDCRYRVSVTAGTIFQDTRIPLRIWFQATWQVVSQKHGISALGLQKILGLKRYETTWNMLHRLRTAMVRPDRDRLMGPVQVDESYIGGHHPRKRGRGGAEKTLVLVAVEDKDGHPIRIRLHKIKDASGEILIPAIKISVQPGSEVRTDGWNGYTGLSQSGYVHAVIRKTAEAGKNLLPLANLVTSLLKRWLMGTHQGKPASSHLDYYLDEFTFRFNRRTSKSRGLLFYRLIEQAVNIEPVKNRDIRGGKRCSTHKL